MTLPTPDEAHYTVSRDPDGRGWACAIMRLDADGAATFYGAVVHDSPLKALARAINVVEGREPASLLVQLGAEEWAQMPGQIVVSTPEERPHDPRRK